MNDIENQHEPDEHYEGSPGPQKGRTLTAWQDFEVEIHAREREIAAMLPTHITRERFVNSAIAAIKQNPDLLRATPRSLFSAITKSAQDGILPDGREGVITVYGDIAQWNPMTHGLRKRARELDAIGIDAQAVYMNDKFVWHQGDNPMIEHVPAQLGTPRGLKIGAYAIFKREDGTILHREVMDATQIETVRAQSKASNSLMWTKFSEEAYRKTVIRRGIKSVPVSEKLEQIVKRDDDLFDFNEKADSLPFVPPRPQKPSSEFDRQETPKTADAPKATEPPKKANGKAEELPKREEAKEPGQKAKDDEKSSAENKAAIAQSTSAPAIADTGQTATAGTTEVADNETLTLAEIDPGDDSTGSGGESAAQELERWFRDQVAEVANTTSITDLLALRDEVAKNVDDAKMAEFKKLCGARAGAILRGELAQCKTVKEVTNLRGKYTAVLAAELATWFNTQCDARQREILTATAKAKKP